ncbi:hypothetical protein VTJ83DRAFT_3262 [Remersonia thermophila]|uniref:Uncharacterized protein n=1 Tax=Remersonia thermophila TaxID=72144 RepID=A0ABR4DEY5_9PEZI
MTFPTTKNPHRETRSAVSHQPRLISSNTRLFITTPTLPDGRTVSGFIGPLLHSSWPDRLAFGYGHIMGRLDFGSLRVLSLSLSLSLIPKGTETKQGTEVTTAGVLVSEFSTAGGSGTAGTGAAGGFSLMAEKWAWFWHGFLFRFLFCDCCAGRGLHRLRFACRAWRVLWGERTAQGLAWGKETGVEGIRIGVGQGGYASPGLLAWEHGMGLMSVLGSGKDMD